MTSIYNNKEAFIKIKPKKIGYLVIMFVLLFISVIVWMSLNFTYNHIETKGIANCDLSCFITVAIPSNISYEKIILNNKKINYEEINKELKVDKDNYISYNEITLKTDLKLQDSEIVNLSFYYNKQRIIKKIFKMMF